jgi:sialate O-acetylesterase
VRLARHGAAEGALSLAGTWQRQRGPALATLPAWPGMRAQPNRPTVLWNGMLAPLAPFPFTGAIWYQGESNRGRADQYARLVPAMIADWRAAFGRELPFYFVQLAPYGYDGEQDGKTPLLREAQAKALAVAKTGMAVTLDCGDEKDIHPAHKQPVGERLARLALARHYGEPIACEGPRVTNVTNNGALLRVQFETGGGALVLAPAARGFELAGADGVFHAADVRMDGTALELSSAAVPQPTQVRYAWSAAPVASLANSEGLPAPPFRVQLR